MTPERAMEIARSITETIYKEEIAQAILTACEAESKLTLEPSPCGVAGHRRVDCEWLQLPPDISQFSGLNHPITVGADQESFCCCACQREQAVAAAMVEKCTRLIESQVEEPAMVYNNNFMDSLIGDIRSISPAGVLDELLFKAKGEALDAACWDEALRKARLES